MWRLGWGARGECWRGAVFALCVSVIALVCSSARADELDYSAIDRATVRVLALDAVDTVEFEDEGARFTLATPMGGHGSGFVVSSDGLIVTAAHVVTGARAVAVHVMGLMGPLPARVVHTDEMRDIALLRVSHQFADVAQLALAGSRLKVRDPVYAIGFPLDATRTDPQSSRGVVSGQLPDGRLQLSISLNPGNSGGPVIGGSDRVVGLVSARGDVKSGVEGLAIAIPVDAFRESVERELGSPTPIASAGATDQKLADLVSLLAHEGHKLVRGSLGIDSDEAMRTERQVRRLLKEMPKSADAALLGAAFFWNRHVADQVHRKDPTPARTNAIYLVKRAVELDPKLQTESKFVRHVLAARTGIEPTHGGARTVVGKAPPDEVHVSFTSQDEEITLNVKIGEGHRQMGPYLASSGFYRRVCQAPCEANLEKGNYAAALSKVGRRLVDVDTIIAVDGPVTIEGDYTDNSAIRITGWVIAGVGGLGGMLYALKTEEECTTLEGFDEPLCQPAYPHFWTGFSVMMGSLLGGAILTFIPDSASVTVTPGVARAASKRYLVGLEGSMQSLDAEDLRGLTFHARF